MSVRMGKRLQPRQRRLAAALAALPPGGEVGGLLAEMGVRESVYRGWLRDEAFVREVERAAEAGADAALPRVWQALVAKCENGDTAAIKLYFELKGRYRQSVDVRGLEKEQGQLEAILRQLAPDWGETT